MLVSSSSLLLFVCVRACVRACVYVCVCVCVPYVCVCMCACVELRGVVNNNSSFHCSKGMNKAGGKA